MTLLLDAHTVLWWHEDDGAQALVERATLVTRDAALGSDGVSVLW